MYVINKYEYPLFLKDIQDVDAKITKRCSLKDYPKMEDALEWCNRRAKAIRKLLVVSHKDKRFNIVDTDNIVKVCFEEDGVDYVIVKFEVVASNWESAYKITV